MPVQTSYPGVYIQELPSGTHTITGVATSITAFVGRAARGPLDTAVTITSQSDYDREFGGLDPNCPMSFAVRDFFANGGSTAVIVRLFTVDGSATPPTGIIPILDNSSATVFTLIAASPGSWAKNLSVVLDNNVAPTAAAMVGVIGGHNEDVFNITVTDSVANVVEVHRNVTLLQSTRMIAQVLAAESELVRWPPLPPLPPPPQIITYPSPASTTFGTLSWPAPPAKPLQSHGVTVVPQDGTVLDQATFLPSGKKGLYALEQVDLFNILVVPPTQPSTVDLSQTDGDFNTAFLGDVAAYCVKRRAILLLDAPEHWTGDLTQIPTQLTQFLQSVGTSTSNCALFFPRIEYPNIFHDSRIEAFAPSGAIAGVMAATDTARGVWKAPAGLEAAIGGVSQLTYDLTDVENGQLNTLGINCIRNKPGVPAPVIWGSRTVEGDDRIQSQWKYLPVRRMALYLEESLYQGTQWVVFEPNDEPLWSQIRTNVSAFMQGLFMQGAFQGQTPDEAYFVKCDDETTTQSDIDNGIVNILVGFAPLKPAEFVVISLQQMAGQTGS